MNAREQEYRLSLELRQVNDVLSCLFHSLLIHRTVAKFTYKTESNYSLGALGLLEVDCDYVDLTYVRLNSPELCMRVDENVTAFRSDLENQAIISPRRTPVGSPTESAVPFISTSVGMEFYQKKHRSWPLSTEVAPWERWNIILDIFKVASLDEFSRMKESVAESVGDIVLNICSKVNRPQYMPKMPTQSQLNDIFETQFSDCQPYLFRINRQSTNNLASQSSFSTVRRLLKDFAM